MLSTKATVYVRACIPDPSPRVKTIREVKRLIRLFRRKATSQMYDHLQILKHKTLQTKETWEAPRNKALDSLNEALANYIQHEQQYWLSIWDDLQVLLHDTFNKVVDDNDDDDANDDSDQEVKEPPL